VSRAIFAVIAASLTLALSACGGDGSPSESPSGGPSIRFVLETDLSGLPPEVDREGVMTSLVDILEHRAVAFGVADVEVQREESNDVSVTLSGIVPKKDARQLLEQKALLQFQQPVLDEDGRVLCQAADGAQFSIPREEITYTPENPGGRPEPRCLGAEGQSGAILWEPVDSIDGQDPTAGATTTIIQPVSATVDSTGAPLVIVSFSPDDSILLEEITTRLLGLPFGIFVDGELLAGPTVAEPATTGTVVIAGLSLRKANILAAQLTAGSLPVPVREISVEASGE
jgi:preprotein translocase subunit SecD